MTPEEAKAKLPKMIRREICLECGFVITTTLCSATCCFDAALANGDRPKALATYRLDTVVALS